MERKNKIYTLFLSIWLVLLFTIGGCVVCITNRAVVRTQNDIWQYQFKQNPARTRDYITTPYQDSIAQAWQIRQSEKLLNEIRR